MAQERWKRTRLVRRDMQHDENRRGEMGRQRMDERHQRFYPAGRSANYNDIVSRQGILQRRPLPVGEKTIAWSIAYSGSLLISAS